MQYALWDNAANAGRGAFATRPHYSLGDVLAELAAHPGLAPRVWVERQVPDRDPYRDRDQTLFEVTSRPLSAEQVATILAEEAAQLAARAAQAAHDAANPFAHCTACRRDIPLRLIRNVHYFCCPYCYGWSVHILHEEQP